MLVQRRAGAQRHCDEDQHTTRLSSCYDPKLCLKFQETDQVRSTRCLEGEFCGVRDSHGVTEPHSARKSAPSIPKTGCFSCSLFSLDSQDEALEIQCLLILSERGGTSRQRQRGASRPSCLASPEAQAHGSFPFLWLLAGLTGSTRTSLGGRPRMSPAPCRSSHCNSLQGLRFGYALQAKETTRDSNCRRAAR
jgi:hypothetical protein